MNNSSNAPTQPDEITDKRGYAARWQLSTRTVSNLLAQGLPHCAVGSRRVRIIVLEADRWMREKFGTRRLGPAKQEVRK